MQIVELYPSLLERLDDAQDPIRIEVCNSIQTLFTKHNNLSTSTFEYIVKTCMIHLDDVNEDVQISMFNTLKVAAEVNSQVVVEEVFF